MGGYASRRYTIQKPNIGFMPKTEDHVYLKYKYTEISVSKELERKVMCAFARAIIDSDDSGQRCTRLTAQSAFTRTVIDRTVLMVAGTCSPIHRFSNLLDL